jgi:sterol desaturase/sphingolipid hydroxylase (fatty acid hydroxylase superfamily)
MNRYDLREDIKKRRKRQRYDTLIGITSVVALFVIVSVLAIAAWGWVVMIFCGVIWHEFDILRPIGFWPSCVIGTVLAFLYRLWTGPSSHE